MYKRVTFIAVVTLVVASAASAGVWDWAFNSVLRSSTSSSQQQSFDGTMGQSAAQAGQGSSSIWNNEDGRLVQTKTTPSGKGRQDMDATESQSTYIYGRPESMGMGYEESSIFTWQGQWF